MALCQHCRARAERAFTISGAVIKEFHCAKAVQGFPNVTACRDYEPVPGAPALESVPAVRPSAPTPMPAPPRAKLHYVEDYRKLVRDLMARHPLDEAMAIAVGGSFQHVGMVEKCMLIQCGLKPTDTLVDVGCGSGRLAIALSDYLGPQGTLFGTDVVPELLQYAADRTPKHWTYKVVEEIIIPFADACADMVSFFSVFTHLLQHESYCYLLEARRVLKPGGRIVFSFLEFPQNWAIFEQTYNVIRSGQRVVHLNEFFGRDAINCWADHLGVTVLRYIGAHDADIEIPGEKPGDPPRRSALGQSICVMEKG